jgi:nucleoside-diphosphate-sugar epimerase
MKKKKTFLVTGGTGFLGRYIVEYLLQENNKVVVFDNEFRGSIKKIKNKKIKFIRGDIRNKKVFFKSLKSIDAIVHLAYINGTKHFYEKPDLVLDVAIKGLINLFDGCKKFKIKELYLASSSEVYQTPNRIPTTEEEMLKIPNIYNPRYSYGGGKILTELMGINYGKKFFKKLIIFRPHNVYGPEMGNEHVIPEFIDRMKKLKGKNFKIQGTGDEVRSFIFIKDFINAFKLIQKKGKHLQIYNIGTNQKIRIKDLAKKISKILNKDIIIKKSKLKKGSTKIRVPDISRIKHLGFSQIFSLDEGIKEIIFGNKF